MTAQRYVHDNLQPHVLPLMSGLPGTFFQQGCHKTASATLSPHFLSCSIPRFVLLQAYLESFGTTSWTTFKFFRTRGVFVATVERDVSGHHTELI
ncbi:uncharacterized protein TNIN_202501 [Trichonephila inaurata madagascariensis]|uniref:Uncharacterized protein n=1 Tax=Trichonephila inaurata madagascariensis TaxID=2747483 RepID=A0A8X6YH39_9ARAC|nr:uncharacterized protein TNIN_202501 [Trichonephila inaurata madagascariensis]